MIDERGRDGEVFRAGDPASKYKSEDDVWVTTQLPQYLHEAGCTANGQKIGCTQPR